MQAGHKTPIYRLIVEIRRCFNELKTTSDAMNADLGVTAAMRAVLEYLHHEGPATVPTIAKAKSVTRQHIQVLADALHEMGLVSYISNPAHQRSKLLSETAAGHASFAEIQRRETAVLTDLERVIGPADVENAAKLLCRIRSALSDNKADSNG